MPPSGRPRLARRALAEGFATFALVFAGCGAIVTDARSGGSLGAAGVGLVFGLVIMVMVYATGHLSGAHINPAVTVAFTLTRHFPARDAVAYVAAQLAGAAAGALVLLAAWPSAPAHLGATRPAVGTATALLYDAVLTAILMFVIMAVSTFGGPITGASMNPARSFGPALASWHWHDLWIYVAAPGAGAALGALAYQLVRGERD
ncbi:MAG: aquaporin [Actinobacteria bacterium]|nr:MAG: aquaporin [Actinomycetota bacterium]